MFIVKPSHPRSSYPQNEFWPYAVGAVVLACAVLAFAAYSAVTHPALASIVKNVSAPISKQEDLWAPVDIVKPTITPIGASAFAVQAADTPLRLRSLPTRESVPTRRSTLSPTDLPTSTATEEPRASPTLRPLKHPAQWQWRSLSIPPPAKC